jgi:hypothetical protein
MEEFKITFWKKPYNAENSFVKDDVTFLTSAIITKTTERTTETFHVKLNDIGLNSLFGEFDIIRQNGLWETSDQDSAELNLLKWSICEVLMNRLK